MGFVHCTGDWTPAAEVWSAPACYLPGAGRGQITGAAAAAALLGEVEEKKLTAERLWAELMTCSELTCEEARPPCCTGFRSRCRISGALAGLEQTSNRWYAIHGASRWQGCESEGAATA